MLELKNKENRVVVKFHDPLVSNSDQFAADHLRQFVRDGDTADTAKSIAQKVSEVMAPYPALNNDATWDGTKPGGHYFNLAAAIDKEETLTFKAVKYNPDTVNWWIDSGLMGSFVGRFRAGNCDDLASYALGLSVANFGGYVIALAQLTRVSHSFVLIQSMKGQLWVLDTWVKNDRIVDYKDSYWRTFDKKGELTLHVAEVAEMGVDITRLWYEWYSQQTTYKVGRVRSSGGPRTEQLGAYTHLSAKGRAMRGL